MTNSNTTYKIGDQVSVDYFGHRFTGVIIQFDTSGVIVTADEPFMKCDSERDGAYLFFSDFYATVRMVKACEGAECRSSQGHTYMVSE